MKALSEFLRPEFINRVRRGRLLQPAERRRISAASPDIMLAELQRVRCEGRGIDLDVGRDAVYELSRQEVLLRGLRRAATCAAPSRRTSRTRSPRRIIDSYVDPFRSIKATCEDGTIKLETI